MVAYLEKSIEPRTLQRERRERESRTKVLRSRPAQPNLDRPSESESVISKRARRSRGGVRVRIIYGTGTRGASTCGCGGLEGKMGLETICRITASPGSCTSGKIGQEPRERTRLRAVHLLKPVSVSHGPEAVSRGAKDLMEINNSRRSQNGANSCRDMRCIRPWVSP